MGAYREAGDAATMHLVSMWVEPSHRGLGIGGRLIETVVAWVRAGGAERIGLWVTRSNRAAAALYARAGFAVTGDLQALPSHPCHEEQAMVLASALPLDGHRSLSQQLASLSSHRPTIFAMNTG